MMRIMFLLDEFLDNDTIFQNLDISDGTVKLFPHVEPILNEADLECIFFVNTPKNDFIEYINELKDLIMEFKRTNAFLWTFKCNDFLPCAHIILNHEPISSTFERPNETPSVELTPKLPLICTLSPEVLSLMVLLFRIKNDFKFIVSYIFPHRFVHFWIFIVRHLKAANVPQHPYVKSYADGTFKVIFPREHIAQILEAFLRYEHWIYLFAPSSNKHGNIKSFLENCLQSLLPIKSKRFKSNLRRYFAAVECSRQLFSAEFLLHLGQSSVIDALSSLPDYESYCSMPQPSIKPMAAIPDSKHFSFSSDDFLVLQHVKDAYTDYFLQLLRCYEKRLIDVHKNHPKVVIGRLLRLLLAIEESKDELLRSLRTREDFELLRIAIFKEVVDLFSYLRDNLTLITLGLDNISHEDLKQVILKAKDRFTCQNRLPQCRVATKNYAELLSKALPGTISTDRMLKMVLGPYTDAASKSTSAISSKAALAKDNQPLSLCNEAQDKYLSEMIDEFIRPVLGDAKFNEDIMKTLLNEFLEHHSSELNPEAKGFTFSDDLKVRTDQKLHFKSALLETFLEFVGLFYFDYFYPERNVCLTKQQRYFKLLRNCFKDWNMHLYLFSPLVMDTLKMIDVLPNTVDELTSEHRQTLVDLFIGLVCCIEDKLRHGSQKDGYDKLVYRCFQNNVVNGHPITALDCSRSINSVLSELGAGNSRQPSRYAGKKKGQQKHKYREFQVQLKDKNCTTVHIGINEVTPCSSLPIVHLWLAIEADWNFIVLKNPRLVSSKAMELENNKITVSDFSNECWAYIKKFIGMPASGFVREMDPIKYYKTTENILQRLERENLRAIARYFFEKSTLINDTMAYSIGRYDTLPKNNSSKGAIVSEPLFALQLLKILNSNFFNLPNSSLEEFLKWKNIQIEKVPSSVTSSSKYLSMGTIIRGLFAQCMNAGLNSPREAAIAFLARTLTDLWLYSCEFPCKDTEITALYSQTMEATKCAILLQLSEATKLQYKKTLVRLLNVEDSKGLSDSEESVAFLHWWDAFLSEASRRTGKRNGKK